MNLSYLEFRKVFFEQGIFSVNQINLVFPNFNSDNLLNWQKKGYILKIRNSWYCFNEILSFPDINYLLANIIYYPSYISHQEALLFYGLIPEHIVDSISVTTKKTMNFIFMGRTYKYYSVSPRYFFGYEFKEIKLNGIFRQFLMADKEKSILDLLYLFDFYKTEEDIAGIRLNESVLETDVDWQKLDYYLKKFDNKSLKRKIEMVKKIYLI